MKAIRGLVARAAVLLVALRFSSAAAATAGTPQAPARLSETGLYAPDGSVDPRNEPFVPQYPLWTDGAAKARWIHLPEGTSIDTTNLDRWRFPVGTKLWKQFSFGGRKVETRMLWQVAPGTWVFAAYVWNEAGTEATLAPEDGVADVAEIAPGKSHSIPGLADCASCHGSAPVPVLGFNALQLSDDRDPLAPHAEPMPKDALTLASLVASHRLEPPRPELVASPPRIRARTPTERAALGYLSGNCGACHNASGPLARVGLNLLHEAAGAPDSVEPAVATALDAPGRWIVPGVPEDQSRLVAPGVPERSAVPRRMRSRRPSTQMPPLGTRLVDEAAVALVERWIAELGAPSHGPAREEPASSQTSASRVVLR